MPFLLQHRENNGKGWLYIFYLLFPNTVTKNLTVLVYEVSVIDLFTRESLSPALLFLIYIN